MTETNTQSLPRPAKPAAWIAPQPRKSLIVGVGDMVVSNDPSAEVATYSLGSCLGVVVYEPERKMGGLLHTMLPDSHINPSRAAMAPFMFLDTGLPLLFHALYSLGAQRSKLIIKAAGGASFLDNDRVFDIGARNQRALAEMLQRNGLALANADMGGLSSRTVRLKLSNGAVTIQCPGLKVYNL
jgi:chemotaxis protein CheD